MRGRLDSGELASKSKKARAYQEAQNELVDALLEIEEAPDEWKAPERATPARAKNPSAVRRREASNVGRPSSEDEPPCRGRDSDTNVGREPEAPPRSSDVGTKPEAPRYERRTRARGAAAAARP